MITFLINHKEKFLNLLKILVAFVVFIYGISSIIYIYNWFFVIQDLKQQQILLKQQTINTKREIELLTFKINGLNEKTLNLDLLESQVKSILNIYNKTEIILIP